MILFLISNQKIIRIFLSWKNKNSSCIFVLSTNFYLRGRDAWTGLGGQSSV